MSRINMSKKEEEQRREEIGWLAYGME